MPACPVCGNRMLARPEGPKCATCGNEMVAFREVQPVAFRAHPPASASRRNPRRGAGLAVTVALLLLAGALGAAGYLLLAQPDDNPLLTLSRAASGAASGPSDYKAPVAQNGLFHRDFSWTYKGRDYTWQMDLTESSYQYFRGLERPERRYQESGVWHVQAAYDIYVSNPDDDPFINALGKALLDQAHSEGFSDDEALSFALAFVQSLPYTRDDVTTGFDEYPRYPVETLVDGGGDCEDTSILYASLVLAMGYGAVMVSPPGHMAAAVAAASSVQGASYTYGAQRYLYAETTGDGYRIGQIPDEYDGAAVTVYDLTPKALFTLNVDFGPVTDGHQAIVLKATQTGSATALNVQLKASVGKSDGSPYDQGQCDAGDVRPGIEVQCRILLDLNKVPRGTRVSVRCVVQDDRFIYDEADSTTWIPRT